MTWRREDSLMKVRFAILMLIPLVGMAGEEKKAPPKAAAAPETTIRRITVPAGAEKIGPETWRYKDASGKTWIYRRTPFGVTRSEEAEKDETEAAAGPASQITAVEDGDSVRFVRRTPFGDRKWTRKKTELDEIERAAWEREQKSRKNAGAGENQGGQ